jgi:hypothetical protein
MHEKMSRGITFTKAEADQICKWLTVRGTDLGRAPQADISVAESDDVPF